MQLRQLSLVSVEPSNKLSPKQIDRRLEPLRREFPRAGDQVLRMQARRLESLELLDRALDSRASLAAILIAELVTRGYLATADGLRRKDELRTARFER